MKFKLCSKYSIIKYSIDLEQLLSSCIDLLLDIVSLLGYTNEDRFGAVFSYEEQNSDITNQSDSLIARVISDVEERMLTMCQSQVNQICLLDIKNKTILVSSDISIKDLKGILNKVITDIGPIKMLFNYVVDPHKDLLNRLLQLNPYKYGGTCVNIPYDMRMDSPILPVDWFEKIGDLYMAKLYFRYGNGKTAHFCQFSPKKLIFILKSLISGFWLIWDMTVLFMKKTDITQNMLYFKATNQN